MSKSVTLRIPDDILERLDCIKGKRSAVILGILQASLYRGHGITVSDEEVMSRRSEVQAVERRSPKPDVASSTLAAPAKPDMQAMDIGSSSLTELSIGFERFHDPKTCRIYGCLMCKMAKEG